jgi:hypothetical protein
MDSNPTSGCAPRQTGSATGVAQAVRLSLRTFLWLALPADAQYIGVTCGWSYGNDLTAFSR